MSVHELPQGEGWGVIYVELAEVLQLLNIPAELVQDGKLLKIDDFGRFTRGVGDARLLLKVKHRAFPRVQLSGEALTYFSLEEARRHTAAVARDFGVSDPLRIP